MVSRSNSWYLGVAFQDWKRKWANFVLLHSWTGWGQLPSWNKNCIGHIYFILVSRSLFFSMLPLIFFDLYQFALSDLFPKIEKNVLSGSFAKLKNIVWLLGGAGRPRKSWGTQPGLDNKTCSIFGSILQMTRTLTKQCWQDPWSFGRCCSPQIHDYGFIGISMLKFSWTQTFSCSSIEVDLESQFGLWFVGPCFITLGFKFIFVMRVTPLCVIIPCHSLLQGWNSATLWVIVFFVTCKTNAQTFI